MKYAIIIPDGAADVKLDELDGKTPLEAANIPNMDWIAGNGRCGCTRNVPAGMPAGSDVAILSLLGYDTNECYTGRAPLEAAAQGLQVDDDDWIFRCNLVTIVDEIMEDFSAGHITTNEAAKIINHLNECLHRDDLKFYPGVSYRHLMVTKGDFKKLKTTPPHDIMGQEIAKNLPKGSGSELLKDLTVKSREILEKHDINIVRSDLGENPANSIWLWGHGKMPQMQSFESRFNIRGAAITAVDLVRGISKLIGWDVINVPGATGYIDTNFAGKGSAAVTALDQYDLVCVHVEATDEAGHAANVNAKVQSLEQIDKHIVGPVLERLKQEGDQWRVMVLPDHPTPCTLRTHTSDPVPFAIAGLDMFGVTEVPFTEESGELSDLHIKKGYTLMEYFLSVR